MPCSLPLVEVLAPIFELQPSLLKATCSNKTQPTDDGLCAAWLTDPGSEGPRVGSVASRLYLEPISALPPGSGDGAVPRPSPISDGSLVVPLLSSSTTPTPLGLAVSIQSAANRTLLSGSGDSTASVLARVLGDVPAAFVGELLTWWNGCVEDRAFRIYHCKRVALDGWCCVQGRRSCLR
jgi:hypothetical protein